MNVFGPAVGKAACGEQRKCKSVPALSGFRVRCERTRILSPGLAESSGVGERGRIHFRCPLIAGIGLQDPPKRRKRVGHAPLLGQRGAEQVMRLAQFRRARDDVATRLDAAGVEVAIACADMSRRRLRQEAGIAVSYGLPREKAYINIEKYGNTSAASIPIALDEAVRLGKLKKGDVALMVAFGAGLTWANAVIRM